MSRDLSFEGVVLTEHPQDHLIVRTRWPGMPAETARGSLRRFAEDVVPHFE